MGYEQAVRPGLRGILETTPIFIAALIFYALLLSEAPVDDVARYVHELGANSFFWDLGHVWAQPLALIVHRLLGSGVGIMSVLEGMNVFSVALGIAILFNTLRRLGHGWIRAALAGLLVAVSFNLMALGPTGHIKLLVFPALALALRHAVLWEDCLVKNPDARANHHLWAAGIWLGIGANLLVSILPMALFVAVCIALRMKMQGHTMRRSLLALLPFVTGTALAGLVCLLAAYVTARVSGGTYGSFIAFVFQGIEAKEDLRIAVASFTEVPFRFTYSLIYNFAYIPDLGSLGRAAMWGLLPDVSSHVPSLVRDAALGLFSGATLLAILVTSVRMLFGKRGGLLLPLGFVAGATAFSAYYNLNDPEHWFQFTLPLVFIAVNCRRRWLDVAVLAIWLPWLTVNNLGLYGIPKARFAFEQRQMELRDALGPRGLYVGFAGYPGEPDTSLFRLDGIERYKLDIALTEQFRGDVSATLADLDAHIAAALARGGKVILFRALDTADWRGPVMSVSTEGLTKERIRQMLQARYDIRGPQTIAGFPAWEIAPASAQSRASRQATSVP